MPVIEALQTKGHEVAYLCREDWDLSDRQAMETAVARCNRYFKAWLGDAFVAVCAALSERWLMGRLAAKTAAGGCYTHVHFHDPWMAIGFLMTSGRQLRKNLRWGVTEHGYGCYGQAAFDDGLIQGSKLMKWLRLIERQILYRADWVICPTSASLKQLARDLAVPIMPAHWQVIPHAVPKIKRWNRQSARTRLDWKPDEFHVVAVGRLAPLKQFDVIIKAIGISEPAMHLTILGEGNETPLRELADRLGLADRVTITVTDDVGLYLYAADCYVSAAATESFGLANLEALAAGVPCICSPVGGVPEVVGAAARLVVPDPTALSEVIDEIARNPILQRLLSEAGLKRGRLWPSTDRIAALYERAYAEKN